MPSKYGVETVSEERARLAREAAAQQARANEILARQAAEARTRQLALDNAAAALDRTVSSHASLIRDVHEDLCQARGAQPDISIQKSGVGWSTEPGLVVHYDSRQPEAARIATEEARILSGKLGVRMTTEDDRPEDPRPDPYHYTCNVPGCEGGC